MKFRIALLAACLLSAPAASLAGPLWLGATGGFGLPFGDFKDVASTGFNVALLGDYQFSRNLAAGGEVGWQTYGGNDDFEKSRSVELGRTVDVTTTAIPALVHGKVMLPAGERSNPYLKLALGLYRTKRKEEGGGQSSDRSATDFAFGVGGGWNIRGGERVKYGVEGVLHFVSTEDKSSNILIVRGQVLFGAGGS